MKLVLPVQKELEGSCSVLFISWCFSIHYDFGRFSLTSSSLERIHCVEKKKKKERKCILGKSHTEQLKIWLG